MTQRTGNIDLQIDPVSYIRFCVLESLIYAMRLKAIGVELEKIQTCLQTRKGHRMILGIKWRRQHPFMTHELLIDKKINKLK